MFKPSLEIRKLTGGINTKKRADKIGDDQQVSILGFDFDADTLRRSKGFTKLGTEYDTTLTGKTIYNHSILTGTEVLVKNIGTFLKYYDTQDDSWYKLTLSTFTANLRWSFASFNGYLYGNNGTDNWIFWNGGARSSLLNAIVAGAVTIDLQVGHGARFAASGSIMIQDDTIAYTGVAGDQLTGVTGVDVDHNASATVIQALDASTYSAVEKARDIAFYKNRLFFISATNPKKIVHSKLADNTNPETDIINFAVGGGSGDGGFGFAPDAMVALEVFVKNETTSVLAVFCEDGIVYNYVVTDGTATTTNVLVPTRTMNSFPKQPWLTCVAENDLAFIDQFGHIRTLSYGDINTPLNVKTISNDIEPSLEATDFDDGFIKYFKRKLRAGGSSITDGINDIFYYHDGTYNSWGAYEHWDCVDVVEYNNTLVGLSQITGNVWTLDDSYAVYLDDAAENNEGTYYSEALSKEFDLGKPLLYKSGLKIRAAGFISSNCPAYLDVFTDGTLLNTFTISGDNTNILSSVPNVAVGTIVFGTGVFGGGLPGGTTRKEFLAQMQFNIIRNFIKIQFRLRIDEKLVDFELSDLIAWCKDESLELWLPQRVLLPT